MMKANEFVKKFGWDYTQHVVKDPMDYSHYLGDTSYSDLKRLVESRELIKEHGSIERAKQYADSKYTAPEVSSSLKQAIADVESCHAQK